MKSKRTFSPNRVSLLAPLLFLALVLGVYTKVLANPRAEVVERRTLNSKTFDNGDGTFTLEAHGGHIHYVDKATGKFAECDTTLIDVGDKWIQSKASYHCEIPKYANRGFTFTDVFEDKNQTLVMRPLAKPVLGEIDNSAGWVNKRVLYRNAYGKGLHLRVTASNVGLFKEIIIDEMPKPLRDLAFDFEVILPSEDHVYVLEGGEQGITKQVLLADLTLTGDQQLLMGQGPMAKNAFSRIRKIRIWDSDGNGMAGRLEFYKKESRLYCRKIVPREFLATATYPVYTDDAATYYAGTGDGYVNKGNSSDWNTTHDAANGKVANYTATSSYFCRVGRKSDANYIITRGFFPFDTTALPGGADIASASLDLYITAAANSDGTGFIVMVQTTQASVNSLIEADYNQCGSVNNPVEGSSRYDIDTIPEGGYFSFDLNATGIGWIKNSSVSDGSGWTTLGLREGHDVDDVAYTTPLDKKDRINGYWADETGTTYDPKLSMIYSVGANDYAPTLDWTGDSGYTTDGVEPNNGDSGSIFEFRVEYTDQDNNAPGTKEVWIDLDDDGYDAGEKFDMAEVNPGDTNYQDGKDYTYSTVIDYAGDGTLKYKFYFNDGPHDATGTPTLDTHTFTVNPPPATTHYVDGDTGDDDLYAPSGYDSTSTPAKTIQAAVDACLFGTVYVKKATAIYGTVDMKSNVHVVGTDATWGEPASRDDYPILYSGPVSLPNFGRAPVRLLGPVSNSRLAYLKITGGKMEEGQIYISGVHGEIGSDVIIENCWLSQGSHVGIMLRGAAAPTIRDCDIEDPISSCISSFRYGIVPTSSTLTIQGCDLSGLTGYADGWGLRAGIRLAAENEGSFDITIGGDSDLANHIHHMGTAGIRLDDLGAGCNITIDNNEIDNNSYAGADGLSAPGILVDNVSKVTITRNTIHDNMQGGIAIANDSDVTVGAESSVTGDIADIQSQYGNEIYGNYAGIAFGLKKTMPSDGTFVIRGNQIYSNKAGTGGGIAVTKEVAGTILIKQNVFTDNYRGGIGIQDDCNAEIVQNRIYNQYQRSGIHTGRNGQNWFGEGDGGGAILTIRQNKIYGNSNVSRGGGIDVRHASGTIENNLVYDNGRAGIRFGDWMDEILNNTVFNNGNDTNYQGGGIIYDELDDVLNDPPSGDPPAPLLIRNNISAYNVKGGIRGCFDNTWEERDYNLAYANNGTGETDCGYPDSINKRCANKNFGGCGAMWNPSPPPYVIMDGPNNMIADPLFKDMAGGDYRLQRLSEGDPNDSPGINAGDDVSDLGAYGGAYPIDDSDIPSEIP